MKSVAINPANTAVTVDFGEYEQVDNAIATLAGASATAVAVKTAVSGITVTVTHVGVAGDAGTGDYYVLANCI